mgnify:CR=1 FL=1
MKTLLYLLILLSLISCEIDNPIYEGLYKLEIPLGFPEPLIPVDNQLNVDRIELGKRLFFDPILSADSTISCSSCHKQEYAFADNIAITPGIEGRLVVRNSMILANVENDGAVNGANVPDDLEDHYTLSRQAWITYNE